jgi:Ca2+/H+ antiporter
MIAMTKKGILELSAEALITIILSTILLIAGLTMVFRAF